VPNGRSTSTSRLMQTINIQHRITCYNLVVPSDMYDLSEFMIDWPMRYCSFCSIELDLVHTNIKQGVHQGYDTFGEGRIRINIAPNGTHMNISSLVRTMNSKNWIARYTCITETFNCSFAYSLKKRSNTCRLTATLRMSKKYKRTKFDDSVVCLG
jgi:hypothetical protein